MSKTALLIENLQIDYCPGGAMEIPNGNELIPIANQLMGKYEIVIASIDWHPANHISFAANHPWRKIGQIMEIDGQQQELFPIHCVKGTFGAAFPVQFQKEKITKIIQKGTSVTVDNYSCFYDVGKQSTSLHQFLKTHEIDTLHFMGMSLELSIITAVKDALALNYKVTVFKDACASHLDKIEVQQVLDNLEQRGATVGVY